MPAWSNKIRDFRKTLLYRSGLLPLYHRVRNRNNVTVVMFHRVLAEDDPRWQWADPTWTAPLSLFEECIRFFKRHYNVIGIEELLRAKEGAKLPPRPLVITLDDGWADNAEYAAPVLERYSAPATIFVVANGVETGMLWDQRLRRVWRSGGLDEQKWNMLRAWAGCTAEDATAAGFRRLLMSLSALDVDVRERLVSRVAGPSNGCAREMLERNEISRLHERGVSIGCHGLTHAMAPYTPDPNGELAGCRIALKRILGADGPKAAGLDVFSFPHGAYDDNTVALAARAGYRMMFGSDPVLNSMQAVRGTVALGRIHIDPLQLSRAGRLRPELLALWLFPRNTR